MKRRHLTATVGVMVLSTGLFLMTDRAEAAPPTKSTSNQSWDENLPSASRFTTVFPGAVRDNNTGLVWEQAPGNIVTEWEGATIYCLGKRVGGTTGWRLPSIVELASVLDPSLPAPFVPASVFNDVQLASYWSATTVAQAPAGAYLENFGFGSVQEQGKQLGSTARAWCVRGPMNADAY